MLIRSAFPEDPHTAVKIVHGESGFRSDICGKVNQNGTIDCGLWQINDVHLPTLKSMGLDRMNPEDATTFARYLYEQQGGWEDWMYYVNHLAMR